MISGEIQVRDAFLAALMLTGTIEAAEEAVPEAIATSGCGVAVEELLAATAKSAVQVCSVRIASMLPPELTGDLLGTSMTTDNVRPSPTPNAWRIGALTIAGVFMEISELIFCTAVLATAKFGLDFRIEALRTVAFVVIVFGNQATTYANRENQRIASCRPSQWLIGSSVVDLLIASTLAIFGIGMSPVPAAFVAETLVAAAVFAFVLDFAKVPVFTRLAK